MDIAFDCIEKRVKDFRSNLQQDMCDEQLQWPTEYPGKPLAIWDASTPQLPKTRRTPRKASKTKLMLSKDDTEKLDTDVAGMGPIKVSSTGFVHFPRHSDYDDDWELVSQRSVSEPEDNLKAGEEVTGTKGSFGGWFRK
jgi:hypothetical protein